MLQIVVPGGEFWDEEKQEFSYGKDVTLSLEHSLISVSKWEMKYHRAFLDKRDKTTEETIDYIRCMTTNHVDDDVYRRLTQKNLNDVANYIGEAMTASHISEMPEEQTGPKDKITSELIYYWMISLNVPFECQKWHLNRLLSLIKVCSAKMSPPKKISRQAAASRYAALNAARRKRFNTKG